MFRLNSIDRSIFITMKKSIEAFLVYLQTFGGKEKKERGYVASSFIVLRTVEIQRSIYQCITEGNVIFICKQS